MSTLARLRRRVPVRLRQHWKLVAACCAVLALVGLGFADARIRPLVTSDQRTTAETVTENIAGTVDIFDSTVAHKLTLTYRDDDYQRMLDEYAAQGEKPWIAADLVIDGTRIPDVGIRLKGNSTLSGMIRDGQPLRERMAGARGGQPPGGQGQMPGGQGEPPGGQGQMPDGRRPGQQGAMPGMRQGAGGIPAQLLAEEPESLPWLISFDKYLEGRRYQGHQRIAVRSAGSGTSVAFNEAVSLALVAESGQPAQAFAYSSFTVNDRPAKVRLLIEDPDESYAADRGSYGVLYKALATSDFSYQGEDPTEYADDFKQINRTGSQDLQPVIDLLRWVGDASDAEFAAGLGKHLDVDSFADYVALQNLLLNWDDMSGPGRNYYLWYDLDTKRFTVLTSDLNLTFTGQATQGPYDNRSFGGMAGGPAAPQGQPAGGQAAPGGRQADDEARPGGMRMGNTIKERFLRLEAFHGVYENAYRRLYQNLFASGGATRVLDGLATTVAGMPNVDKAAIDSQKSSLSGMIESRRTALADDKVIAAKG